MAEVIVFGTSQWAELADFYLTRDSPHDVAAFTVDRDYLKTGEFKGREVVAFDNELPRSPEEVWELGRPAFEEAA